jgi:hypothetical protein
MRAFRLERISPAMATAIPGPSPVDRRIEAVREEAYRLGFLAGQAAAHESFLDDQGRLTSELVEALADARLTNEAARRHVAASIGPMIEALAAGIAPALAEAGLVPEVARIVERALLQAPGARPRLRCAPEVAPRLADLLLARGLDAVVEQAPELLPREAQIFWDQGYDHLDLDGCVAQVRACIASHLERNSTSADDDPRQAG